MGLCHSILQSLGPFFTHRGNKLPLDPNVESDYDNIKFGGDGELTNPEFIPSYIRSVSPPPPPPLLQVMLM